MVLRVFAIVFQLLLCKIHRKLRNLRGSFEEDFGFLGRTEVGVGAGAGGGGGGALCVQMKTVYIPICVKKLFYYIHLWELFKVL